MIPVHTCVTSTRSPMQNLARLRHPTRCRSGSSQPWWMQARRYPSPQLANWTSRNKSETSIRDRLKSKTSSSSMSIPAPRQSHRKKGHHGDKGQNQSPKSGTHPRKGWGSKSNSPRRYKPPRSSMKTHSIETCSSRWTITTTPCQQASLWHKRIQVAWQTGTPGWWWPIGTSALSTALAHMKRSPETPRMTSMEGLAYRLTNWTSRVSALSRSWLRWTTQPSQDRTAINSRKAMTKRQSRFHQVTISRVKPPTSRCLS